MILIRCTLFTFFFFFITFIGTARSYALKSIYTDSKGNVWGERLNSKMEWENAVHACELLGASLPTVKHYQELMSDLGETSETAFEYLFLKASARNKYNEVFNDIVDEAKNSAFWTSSMATREGFYQIFLDGSDGDSFLDYSLYKTRRYAVRCVR